MRLLLAQSASVGLFRSSPLPRFRKLAAFGGSGPGARPARMGSVIGALLTVRFVDVLADSLGSLLVRMDGKFGEYGWVQAWTTDRSVTFHRLLDQEPWLHGIPQAETRVICVARQEVSDGLTTTVLSEFAIF